MSVQTTANRVPYIANGIQTAFPYPFKIFKDSDLQVFVDGVEQVLNTDYLVSDPGQPSGGNVIFTIAPADEAVILIIRVIEFTQETVYPANDKFPAKVHEDVVDRLTMMVQQLNEVDQRTPKLAVTSEHQNILLPDPSVGKILRWKTITELENADVVPLGGITLPLSIPDGGTGLTSVGTEGHVLTSVGGALAYRVGGRIRLTNESGVQQGAGAVVIADPDNDSAFITTTSVGIQRPVLIVDETIDDTFTGYLVQHGIVTVNVQGNVARGDFLATSATAGRAASIGATAEAGAFAYALTAYGGGAAGQVVALLLGSTVIGVASKPAYILTPESALLPDSNFATLVKNVGTNQTDYTLDYDTTTEESAFWRVSLPAGVAFTGAEIQITSRQPAATSGTVGWKVTTLSRADGEAFDTAGVTDTVATSNVKGTAGQLLKQTKSLTITGWAAGETLYVKIARDVANDNVAEDAKLVEAVLRLT